jgi:chromosomal replication initiator protein
MIRSKKELSLVAVEKSLAGLLNEQKKKALTPEAIVKAVAEVFDIRPSDIMGRSQNQECSLPRQVAMYLCRSQLKLSYLKIADVFSRDHSTVMTSVKGVEKKLGEQDDSVLSQVDAIKSKFKF